MSDEVNNNLQRASYVTCDQQSKQKLDGYSALRELVSEMDLGMLYPEHKPSQDWNR